MYNFSLHIHNSTLHDKICSYIFSKLLNPWKMKNVWKFLISNNARLLFFEFTKYHTYWPSGHGLVLPKWLIFQNIYVDLYPGSQKINKIACGMAISWPNWTKLSRKIGNCFRALNNKERYMPCLEWHVYWYFFYFIFIGNSRNSKHSHFL